VERVNAIETAAEVEAAAEVAGESAAGGGVEGSLVPPVGPETPASDASAGPDLIEPS
jgi:hypothetical protein